MTEQARDVGGSVMEKAKDLGERAQDAMTSLKEKAGEVASNVGHKVTDTWEAGRDYVPRSFAAIRFRRS
jgi:hypothetical protein